jgi:hypothetical protein
VTSDDAAAASAPVRRLTDDEALQHARFKQEQAFIPTTNLEALVLKIIGGWEQLKAAVNMYRFLEAGPDGEPLGQEDVPAAMNKLGKEFGLRWPHQRFAAKVNHCNQVRQKFAHFLFVSAIVGDKPPNRTLYFTRLGKAGDSYKAKRNALGLEWRDDEWAQQQRHEDSITEQELRDTLVEMKELIEWCRALRRLAGILENSPNLPDDHPINTGGWGIPWRTEKEPLLVLSDLRVASKKASRTPARRSRP